ncbi:MULTISPECIES: glycosyltransferase [unclassified Mesorhizobium]|uniref:glycosyltransferase n=1 Tax=unclassified Mesorhizobium TaxID=325217 RepID=UPI000FD34706|nr:MULTISPECIES: glycosyltransferase [unclassified Mesorhizobium]RVB77259.1 glycosyltransferase [Mesorhizobium sp. M6A.T.Cr.TU.014.01.1.1]RWP73688.1 MAG: glycosyltransferase [Mesorhizobium sp.]RWQ05199.1 MAG: glycosyltransferase [Mesorhizobium sp.]RWQ10343.1 MAG: glycosyltransferase [Mesorhizobium sp.]
MPQEVRYEPAIAVLLPCYNEELTIADVVRRFRETLPTAAIYVYDNNSRDLTALRARAAGATVIREPRQGKGNVVRRMFADIEADIYLMADGDGTYAPEDAPQLINTLLTERSDMVVGTRRGVTDDAGRTGHAFGNSVFNRLYKWLFGSEFTDIFSGYRAFTRRFVKSFPAVSGGFEIETEMSVHASQLKLPVSEIGLDYGRRPEGSSSKLSTYRDGAKILWMFAMLMKETQPLRFFGAFAVLFLASSLFLMTPVLIEFVETGLVPRMPTWVLSVGLVLLSMLAAVTGLILDSVSRGRAEQKRIFYLSMPSGRVEREHTGAPSTLKTGPGKTPRAA